MSETKIVGALLVASGLLNTYMKFRLNWKKLLSYSEFAHKFFLKSYSKNLFAAIRNFCDSKAILKVSSKNIEK